MIQCKRCRTQLNGPVDKTGVTVCPNCGKRWQLTPDRAAIVSTTLQIQPVEHASEVPQLGENRNG
jgi:uncharacterized Zn finger protein (UPF0148 family)